LKISEEEQQGKWWTYPELGAIHEWKGKRNEYIMDDETSSKLRQPC